MMGINGILAMIAMIMLLLASSAAASDDHTLGIFGNANEDETINMQDVTYTELIILEYRDETELADGKHDGKINMQDVTQIELIILGQEKELTFLDGNEDVITIAKPIERIIVAAHDTSWCESVKAIGAKDKVVGVDDRLIEKYATLFPELSTLPCIGNIYQPDLEAILSLDPDVILSDHLDNIDQEKIPGIAAVFMVMRESADFSQNIKKLGYILDKKDEADEFINWRETLMDEIKTRTEGISEDEKPRVFNIDYNWKPGMIVYQTPNGYLTTQAGGIDLGSDLPGYWPEVDAEWLLEKDPEIVLLHIFKRGTYGYGIDDPSPMKTQREDFMNAPEFANVKAVQNGDVYCHARDVIFGCGAGLVATVYFAKWFHPEKFQDIDPKAIHQEYLTEFQRLDYNLDERGVFVYPPLEES